MKPSEKPIDRVDQFFKNKLEDHSMAPSENAWAKVEAGLSKKNNVVLWRWAAAALLMGALITIIYSSQRGIGNSQPALAEKKIKKGSPVASDPSNLTQPKTESPSQQSSSTFAAKKNSTKSLIQPAKIESEEIQKKETIAVVDHKIKKTEADDMNQGQEAKNKIEEKIIAEATPKKEVASTTRKPIKLEFTLEDLPSVETVATTNEVKNTGLKKVLELAREMKQGEGPLTSLREKKNELFAHNFITGKERIQ